MLCLTCLSGILSLQSQIPHLQKNGNATQLIVDGKPYLMLAGEVGNSSGSNIEYMNKIMKSLRESYLNSVLVSVSWEIIEPSEGVYDFKSVDELIRLARENNLRLGILWFGAWKNGFSPYAPSWVLNDTKRFVRVKDEMGNNMRILTPFCEATMHADAKAFAALMKHLAAVDGEKNTVLVMQIENEVGVLHATRDFGTEANKLYASSVPEELIKYLVKNKEKLEIEIKTAWENNGSKTKGRWTEIFGDTVQTNLFFMAWYYARYVNTIAEAGKENYKLPMYANCWMPQPRPHPGKPGDYPSGGPIITVMDIWKAAAPFVDMIGPDLYGADFKDETKHFHRADNPLFIPETNTTDGPATYAFAEQDAICFSPFGIDNRGSITAKEYAMLAQLTPVITSYQGTGKMFGIYKHNGDTTSGRSFKLNEDVTITVNYQKPFRWPPATPAPAGTPTPPDPASYGLFIQTGENEFIIAGNNLSVSASATNPKKETWLKEAWQGEYKDGIWEPRMLHNGDEAGFLRGDNPTYGIREYHTFPTEPAIFHFKVLVYDK